MRRSILILLSPILLISCEPNSTKVKVENYNFKLSKLIFANPTLTKDFVNIFDGEDSLNTVFKVLVSRRDRFVRVTIYRLINREEINEYPSSFFVYHSKTFLCYNGSEVIDNERVDNKLINRLKEKMKSGNINDSRVFQFDVDSHKNIKLNLPAKNPYDFDLNYKTDTVNFSPPVARQK